MGLKQKHLIFRADCVGGGLLDSRDEAVDLRDRLQRDLDARELPS